MEITLLFVSLLAYFIIAPFTKLKENKILRIIVITIIGTLIGWEKPIFKLGVQPFLLAELFKILLLLFLTPTLLKAKKLIKVT